MGDAHIGLGVRSLPSPHAADSPALRNTLSSLVVLAPAPANELVPAAPADKVPPPSSENAPTLIANTMCVAPSHAASLGNSGVAPSSWYCPETVVLTESLPE